MNYIHEFLNSPFSRPRNHRSIHHTKTINATYITTAKNSFHLWKVMRSAHIHIRSTTHKNNTIVADNPQRHIAFKCELRMHTDKIIAKGIIIKRSIYMAKAPSTLRVSGTQCKLTSSIVNSVIVIIPIRKYKKTMSERVKPLGTIANTIKTNQANKARTAMDMLVTLC